MASKVKPIPDGAPRVLPMLVCRDPAALIDFCKTTFGAEERVRRPGPGGTVAHALLAIGEAMIMIEGEFPTVANRAPQADGTSPVVIYVYVEDVDQAVERAVAAGARVMTPVTTYFWGDRTGRVMDPSGHTWLISTRVEETTEEERQKRAQQWLGSVESPG